jgi:hypothetical protein
MIAVAVAGGSDPSPGPAVNANESAACAWPADDATKHKAKSEPKSRAAEARRVHDTI